MRVGAIAALLVLLADGTAQAATNPCSVGGTAPVITSPDTPVAPVIASDVNFDCMAWQSFISLNWPAMARQPGVPDPSKPLGSPGPTVWETFATEDQIFLPNGARPAAMPTLMAAIDGGEPRALSQRSKVSPAFFAARAALRASNRAVADIEPELSETHQSDGSVLVDLNGQFVYYEELLDPTEVGFIVANGLYQAGAQNAYAATTPIALPPGSIELKSAWKVMGNGDTPSHFLTTQAVLDGGSTQVTVGLVGFHIILRVQGFNQGIWATFMQAENAPLAATTTGHYSFYNPACPTSACPVNTVTTPPTPVQVVQVFPVDKDAASVNTYVQSLIEGQPTASMFGWYRLINVQWPQSSTPLPPAPQTAPLPTGSPSTNTLMNPVLETFMQTSQYSCLSSLCHSAAQTANPPPGKPGSFASGYSFLFGHAKLAP
jgi:hypothetical protein